MPVKKMNIAECRAALAKEKEINNRLKKDLENTNTINQGQAAHMEHMRNQLHAFEMKLTAVEDELRNCGKAFTKSRADNKILVKKINTAWAVMEKLATGGNK